MKPIFALLSLLMFACLIPPPALGEAQHPVPQETADRHIETRIKEIVRATGRLPQMTVRVQEGLVFLEGSLDSEEHREWSKKIITGLEGVVAIIDNTTLTVRPASILEPAKEESKVILSQGQRLLPYMASSFVIIVFFFILATLVRRLTRSALLYRGQSSLIANAAAKFATALILLLGLYFALKASGLSGLAMTVLGGTGALGIGLGLALKNTFENYASGIMISLKDVFRKGEAVEIDGHEGVIQSVTTRGTTIMDYDGNSITIPNSQVMSSSIKNLTRNPKMRINFAVGIGYEDSIDHVRDIVFELFSKHPDKILDDPKPMVAVEALGSATVNLKIHFWINAHEYSPYRLKSWAIQLVKETLMAHQISMPDDAREIVFASPLQIQKTTIESSTIEHNTATEDRRIDGMVSSVDDNDLRSEAQEINDQVKESEAPEKGTSLI